MPMYKWSVTPATSSETEPTAPAAEPEGSFKNPVTDDSDKGFKNPLVAPDKGLKNP